MVRSDYQFSGSTRVPSVCPEVARTWEAAGWWKPRVPGHDVVHETTCDCCPHEVWVTDGP